MKEIKIMLLSLVVIAAIGGTLAFKARYIHTWCVSGTTGACPASGLSLSS